MYNRRTPICRCGCHVNDRQGARYGSTGLERLELLFSMAVRQLGSRNAAHADVGTRERGAKARRA